jgi:hypothetical protein
MEAKSKTRIHVAPTITEENEIEDDEPGRRAQLEKLRPLIRERIQLRDMAEPTFEE